MNRKILLVLGALAAGCGSGAGTPGTSTSGSQQSAVPQRVEFVLGSLSISKEGDRILQRELRTLYSTMPQPEGTAPESSEISQRTLTPQVFAEIWAELSAFDFGPYKGLGPSDFRSLPGPTDTAFSSSMKLVVDGREIISLDLSMGLLKDRALQARLDELAEAVQRPIRAQDTRDAWSRVTGVPQTLHLQFGRCSLNRKPGRTSLLVYFLFTPQREQLEKERPRLLALAEAHPERLKVDMGSVEVTLDDGDFQELWKELKNVDFPRLAGLRRHDFLFRDQRSTYLVVLNIDGQPIIGLQHADREIRHDIAAPLIALQAHMLAKLWQSIERLEQGR